jgi:hypothetical protein
VDLAQYRRGGIFRGDVRPFQAYFQEGIDAPKCLHGFAPPYLTDDCVLVSSLSGRQHLPSADTRKWLISRASTNNKSRSFSVFGLNCRIASKLPWILCVPVFRQELKINLFNV